MSTNDKVTVAFTCIMLMVALFMLGLLRGKQIEFEGFINDHYKTEFIIVEKTTKKGENFEYVLETPNKSKLKLSSEEEFGVGDVIVLKGESR